ncbi:hypothetical protein FPV67DRAFT_1729618 [Lyophyllum atratum]|nr:hypothetical protein FPV67DRAFT_1729618 [Lyophyllum atratum]
MLKHRMYGDLIQNTIQRVVEQGPWFEPAPYSIKSTISSREIQTSVRLILPGELAKDAISEGTKSVVTRSEVNDITVTDVRFSKAVMFFIYIIPLICRRRHLFCHETRHHILGDQSTRSRNALLRQPHNQDQEPTAHPPPDPFLLPHTLNEIGLTVFIKTSFFWKEGKERVQKAYVERASASGAISSSSTHGVGGGRPKWMTQPIGGEGQGDDPWKDGLGEPVGFSDDAGQRRTRVFLFYASSKEYASTTSRARAPSPIRQRRTSSLLRLAPSPPLRSTKTWALPNSCSVDIGYAEAVSAYTLGLGTLPVGHLLLVSLHYNRAIARLRTGDHAGAIADAGAYHLAREAKAERAEEGAGVELGDGLVKALKKRAEAWEGREKSEEAGRDWEVLARMEWAGEKVREEAARGAGRCRRMAAQEGRGIQGVRVEEILGVGVDMMDLERKQNPPAS